MKRDMRLLLLLCLISMTGMGICEVRYMAGIFSHMPRPLYPKSIRDYYTLSTTGGIEGTVVLSPRTAFNLEIFFTPLAFQANLGDSWLWQEYDLYEGTSFGGGNALLIAAEINLKQSYPLSRHLNWYWLCGFGMHFQKYEPLPLDSKSIKDPLQIQIREDELSPAYQFGTGIECLLLKRYSPYVEFERQFIFTNVYPTAFNIFQVGLRIVVY